MKVSIQEQCNLIKNQQESQNNWQPLNLNFNKAKILPKSIYQLPNRNTPTFKYNSETTKEKPMIYKIPSPTTVEVTRTICKKFKKCNFRH